MQTEAGLSGSFHFLAKGDFKGLVLSTLMDKAMHGYEIMKALEERSHGFYKPSPGSIYPTLGSLLRKGYVTVTGGDRRKTYRITPEGRAYLRGRRAEFEKHFKAIEEGMGPERAALFREFRSTARLLRTNMPNLTPGQAKELRKLITAMRERILRILAE